MAKMRELKIQKGFTNHNDYYLSLYLKDISKIKMITQEREVALAQRIRQGDKAALDELCVANTRFVVSVAKQYQNQGLTLPDLISEGNIGLIKAANRFDETRGFKFISYAVWWIRQQILQALAENARIVRLPSNQIGNLGRLKKTFSSLEQEFERTPSVEEVAEVAGLPVGNVETLMANSPGKHLSLSSTLKEGEDGTLLDVMENDEFEDPSVGLERAFIKHGVENVLEHLSKREQDIIKLYHGFEGKNTHTLEEIGQKLGLTRERVRQIKEKAIFRMKWIIQKRYPYLYN